MQSRLGATATRLKRVFIAHQYHRPPLRGFAIYSGGTERIDAEKAAKATTARNQIAHKPSEQIIPFVPPKPTYAPFPKLERSLVCQPIDPITQQRRHHSTTTITAPVEDVSCAGLDGTPWPDDGRDSQRSQMEEQDEDDLEYYKHHKASPLSEIEVADSRKPITRATDGTADSYYGGGEGVILWRLEQLDTAEEALRRAMEIWKQSAMRGDPDSPHSRVLRALRGEDW